LNAGIWFQSDRTSRPLLVAMFADGKLSRTLARTRSKRLTRSARIADAEPCKRWIDTHRRATGLVLEKRQIIMADFDRQNALQAAVVAVMLGMLSLIARSTHPQGVVLPLSTEDKQMINAQLGPHIVGMALPSTPIEDLASTSHSRKRRRSTGSWRALTPGTRRR
jgi:hypothetical protein